MWLYTVRGGKRKLTSAEDGVDSQVVAENSSKSEGKVTETKRPKRQAATVDKVKVINYCCVAVEWVTFLSVRKSLNIYHCHS